MRIIAAAILCLGLVAGSNVAAQDTTVVARYVVVRHAEKASNDLLDPDLSPAGALRAQRLAELLHDEPLGAVYVTGYRRTFQTGEPSASDHGLQPIVYDANLPASAFAAQLRLYRPSGTALIVGHSNTAPNIAAALCSCKVAPMSETEFDRRMIIDFDALGRATLRIERNW